MQLAARCLDSPEHRTRRLRGGSGARELESLRGLIVASQRCEGLGPDECEPWHPEGTVAIRETLRRESCVGNIQNSLRLPINERDFGARHPDLPLAEGE